MMRRKLQTGRGSIAITLAALLAEATLLEEDTRFEFISRFLVCDVFLVVWFKRFPIHLSKGNIVLLVKVLSIK